MSYDTFIKSKSQWGNRGGFEPSRDMPFLYDFQDYLVRWALSLGRAAIFADCGMGKTAMQLAWAQQVIEHTGKPVLIVTPLAVGAQTVEEAGRFGLTAKRSRDGNTDGTVCIWVTNYEQLHKFDHTLFAGVVCDESSGFPGDIIRLHESLGFEMLPRICIWKEPLAVRNRTMSKALAHRQICEDATLTNVASADYLIPFRKRGVNPEPVTHPNGLLEYHGEREIPKELKKLKGYTGNQIENRFSHWIWRHYASSFWDDIRIDNVLPYEESKDEGDERHQHPLQLDVIARAVQMWTNPNDVVLTPFMGVGSEVYGAVIQGRKGIGCELKPSYYRQAVKNLAAATEKTKAEPERLLFDMEVE